MSKITALNNQSLIDLALQTTGLATNYLQIALANGLVPTDKLVAGQEVVIPEGLIAHQSILRFYKSKAITPATAVSTEVVANEIALSCEEKLYECFK